MVEITHHYIQEAEDVRERTLYRESLISKDHDIDKTDESDDFGRDSKGDKDDDVHRDAIFEKTSNEAKPINVVTATISPPALLYVCRESCKIVQKKYCLPLDTTARAGHVWEDSFEDTIFIPFSKSLPQYELLSGKGLSIKTLSMIQPLAVDIFIESNVLTENRANPSSLRTLKRVHCAVLGKRWAVRHKAEYLFDTPRFIVRVTYFSRGFPKLGHRRTRGGKD